MVLCAVGWATEVAGEAAEETQPAARLDLEAEADEAIRSGRGLCGQALARVSPGRAAAADQPGPARKKASARPET